MREKEKNRNKRKLPMHFAAAVKTKSKEIPHRTRDSASLFSKTTTAPPPTPH